jgi:hypothetical protein
MVKTNAQRQAAYRARHLKEGDGMGERLNSVIDIQAKRALERLAACYGVTQRDLLERLISEAERIALGRVASLPNGYSDYYDKQIRIDSPDLTE